MPDLLSVGKDDIQRPTHIVGTSFNFCSLSLVFNNLTNLTLKNCRIGWPKKSFCVMVRDKQHFGWSCFIFHRAGKLLNTLSLQAPKTLRKLRIINSIVLGCSSSKWLLEIVSLIKIGLAYFALCPIPEEQEETVRSLLSACQRLNDYGHKFTIVDELDEEFGKRFNMDFEPSAATSLSTKIVRLWDDSWVTLLDSMGEVIFSKRIQKNRK